MSNPPHAAHSLSKTVQKKRIKILLTGVNRVPNALPLSSEDTVSLIQQHLRCKRAGWLPVLVVRPAFKAAKIKMDRQRKR